MGLISINLDIMSPKKRLFAVSAFFCLTPYRQSQGKFMKGRGRGHEPHFNFKRPPNQKIRASSPRLLLFLDHELTPPYSG